MNHMAMITLSSLGLFFGMLFLLETGRRIGIRRIAQTGDDEGPGTGALDGAIFGLMGLLVAFTFSGAAARFDARRQLLVEETNAIGTAYLRLDVLPSDAQTVLRQDFRQYVEARLAVYRKLPDLDAAKRELARATEMQGKIWSQTVAACRESGAQPATMLLLPALNEMFDITTTRTLAAQTHPPLIIFVMLFGLALASSLVAGHGMARAKKRNWIHMVAFAATLATSVYIILDLEYPRAGLIRVDAFDQALVELRESMK